jgi:hypothetical protein
MVAGRLLLGMRYRAGSFRGVSRDPGSVLVAGIFEAVDARPAPGSPGIHPKQER